MSISQQVNFGEKQINYRVSGEGPCLVLLHGFLESLKIWDDFAETLASDFKTISIDLPGHGKTPNFLDTHTMSFMANTVKAVLDHLKVNECVMAGHSMGGYVTLAFAEKYPDTLKGFCLFHSQAVADSDEVKVNRDRTLKIVKANRKNFIQLFIPDLFASANREVFKIEIERLMKQAEETSKKGIIAALKGMKERTDNTELLKTFKKPVLFIIGKEDLRIPLEKALYQSSLPNRCTAHILGGVGHMGYIEAKNETLQYIKQFTLNAFNYPLNK